MKKKLFLTVVFFLFGLVIVLFLGQQDKFLPSRPTHPLIFFDKELFDKGVIQAKSQSRLLDYPVTTGIIPHDIFASFIIADFFQKLSFQKPKTIILVGPNHSEKGNFKVLTSLYDWQTPFGTVKPNESIIKSLMEQNLAKVDEEVLEKEQAVRTIMPFVNFYLPNTLVVPIILSSRIPIEEISVLAEKLEGYAENGVPVIASVDFSHYLKSREAQKNDNLTLKLMKNFDYQKLLTLGNGYLDSPSSIVAVLMVAEKLEKTNFEIFYHTNSGELTKNDYTPTTSYFSIAFR